MKFKYRSKGSADDWTIDTLEAPSKEEALQKLDEIYGVQRSTNGEQTNSGMIQVELIK